MVALQTIAMAFCAFIGVRVGWFLREALCWKRGCFTFRDSEESLLCEFHRADFEQWKIRRDD